MRSVKVRRLFRSRFVNLAIGVLAASASFGCRAAPLDEGKLARDYFGGDAPWYENNIPFFETSDSLLQQIYYYRWKVFRAHQRDLGTAGYITTEFLDDVSWQRQPFASLNDASAFHIMEGRWLRDRRYSDDYVEYLLEHGGNDHHFSESIAAAVYARFLVDGDLASAARHLPSMRASFLRWDDHWDASKGLYWIEPIYDATEYSISSIDASGGKDGFFGGQAFRPSINSYMFANARAISRLSALVADEATARDFAARAASLKSHIENDLWSRKFDHFIDRYQVSNQFVRYWEPIRGRELVGYLPWAYGVISDPRFASSWKHVLDAGALGGKAGLRTVEPAFPHYMQQYRYDDSTKLRECQWNGPVWPFQTTQVLQGLANLLHGGSQSVIDRADYVHLLRQYAQLHMAGDEPDIQEDYDPDTGAVIVGLPRSHHYMHSAFDDLIVTGFAGLVPREDDVLVVDPILPEVGSSERAVTWFALQDVPYHGHLVTIVWDVDGKHFNAGAGLRIFVDSKLVAQRASLGRIELPLARRAAAQITRPIDLAMNLGTSDFPKGSASVNDDQKALHESMDGRVQFFKEQPNGWTNAGSDHDQDWFEIDFGKALRLGSAELDFFDNGQDYQVPKTYHLQWWEQGIWHDVPVARWPIAIRNGSTDITWTPITTQKLRVVIERPARSAVRLVEFKAF